ncbi:N-acetylmuramoyl-L-alanine amidase [Kribbella sp. NPDC023972]|uniref:N-acetylmuramoyl-L-alanine amidase n=1 Tax=Kribbella sp. NPDC023972 TaxID=3154795 RepID=UPI0033D82299
MPLQARPAAPAPSAAEQAPVDASYQEIPLRQSSRAFAATDATGTKPFELVGITWPKSTQKVTAQVRVQRDGAWSKWETLDVEDEHGPDPGTPEGRGRSGTDPLWVGKSQGVQASVTSSDGRTVDDAKVVLINPGVLATDAEEPAAETFTTMATGETPYPMPAMASRRAWGADERLRSYNPGCVVPKYTSTVQAAFVHHTADRNTYTREQVPAIMRATYAYHVKSRGWCDIGYNFLVDRFGRVFEGRYGGAQLPVLGAHTGGFNTNSFGVALIGNFQSATPTSAMLEKTARVIAWKFDANYRSPLTAIVMNGVRLRTISGHRDTKATECPGRLLYNKLGWLRQRVGVLMGGSVSTPIYRFARQVGFSSTGEPFWGEHRTKTGWGTYFANRDVFYSQATGTHSTVGVFRSKYRKLGLDASALGLPVREYGQGKRGTLIQAFRYGALYWSKPYGIHPVAGPIFRSYVALGAEQSRLGLPMTDMYTVTNGIRQKYERGWLTYNAHQGKVYVTYLNG